MSIVRRCGRRVIPGVLGILVADHLVRPVEQLLAVFLRHAHQAGNRLQRQLAGHLLDEITGALGGGRLVQRLVGARPKQALAVEIEALRAAVA